jgi:hypothetical protein
MKMTIMKKQLVMMCICLIAGVLTASAQAQTKAEQDNYTKVITERSAKIVTAIGVTDSAKFKRVRDILVDQYRTLGIIHDTRNAQVKEIKDQLANDKAAANTKIAAIDSNVDKQLSARHVVFLAKLSKELTPEQVTGVKDGMTYNVLKVTYNAYTDELPQLTNEQKAQIMSWLVEAREKAIDAESSDKKHAVFGKYKGRINNYLSKQGYDMKQAGIEWQKRIKERQAAAKG